MACDFPLLRRKFWGAAGWIEDNNNQVPSTGVPHSNEGGSLTLNTSFSPPVQTMLKVDDPAKADGRRPAASSLLNRVRTEQISLNLSSINKEDVPKSELQLRREKFAYFEKRCSKVEEGVYLGSDAVARNRETLRAEKITHVLNCAGHICFNYFEGELQYQTLWLEDTPAEDVTGILYLALDFVDAAIKSGGHVLIHCSQGVSRSSSLAIGYLMYRRGDPYDTVYQAVKAIHGIANPNMGFACQLVQWQRRLQLQSDTAISDSRLYIVAPHSQIDARTLVTKPTAEASYSALDSRGVFILHAANNQLFVWIGAMSTQASVEYSQTATLQLHKYEHSAYPPTIMCEGQENALFLSMLGVPEGSVPPSLGPQEGVTSPYESDFKLIQLSSSPSYVPPTPGMAVYTLHQSSRPSTSASKPQPSTASIPNLASTAPLPSIRPDTCMLPAAGPSTGGAGDTTARDQPAAALGNLGLRGIRNDDDTPMGSGEISGRSSMDCSRADDTEQYPELHESRGVLREMPGNIAHPVPLIGPDGRMSRMDEDTPDKDSSKKSGRVALYEYPDLEQLMVFDIDDLDSEGVFVLLVRGEGAVAGGEEAKVELVFVWVGRDHEAADEEESWGEEAAHDCGAKLGVAMEGVKVKVEWEGEESNEFWQWFEEG